MLGSKHGSISNSGVSSTGMLWVNTSQVHDKSPVNCEEGVETVTYDPMGVQLRPDVTRMLIAMW